ncbi:MAG: SUF system NifU family Fe-S cluster assembly protein [Planctomycetota bacterium]|nr:SUF system NifU family Fe-S cluster assembly protein [Planctomycetota bacterium]
MSDLRELYQEMILDHCKRPRNFHNLPDANRAADGFNRLCGDKLRVFVKLDDGIIKDIAFEGDGCCISKASSSMMTEALKGKTLDEAHKLFQQFHEVLTGPPDETPDAPELGKLAVFAGVREFPVRVKCATLAWHTLEAALKDEQKPVTTE